MASIGFAGGSIPIFTPEADALNGAGVAEFLLPSPVFCRFADAGLSRPSLMLPTSDHSRLMPIAGEGWTLGIEVFRGPGVRTPDPALALERAISFAKIVCS